MTQELLHDMQERLPIFILIAAGLLDLCGASRSERDVSEMLGLSFPGESQPRAESSPVPSEGLPVTEDNLEEVTFPFQSPAADPTKETAAASTPAHPERAANRTALLPGDLAGNLKVSEPLHAETAALKLQDGHTLPGKLLGGFTQGPQATTALEQPDRSLQRKPGDIPGAGLPQPLPSAGTHQGSPELTAVPSLPLLKQMGVTWPKTSLLTSTVHFHSPGKETAASPFPTGVRVALGSARLGWLPTGIPPTSKRPGDTNAQAQPGSTEGVIPAPLKRTQGVDAGVTTSTVPPKPGHLDGVYSRTTHARAVQFSPVLSLQQETTASKGRNSTAAVANGSGHPTQAALQTLPPGHAHSSSLLMESSAPGRLIPSPFQGPLSTTGGQLALYRALNCTKHACQETNRSSQETTVLALQRDTEHGMMTRNPGKSTSPETPQTSANPSSLSPSVISTLKLFQTTKELKEGTSAPSPGMFAFGNADLQPWDSVHEGLQPSGASFPARAGLQPLGIPTSAERRLHTPTTPSTSTGSGAQAQGVSAHPVSREAFAVMLQLSMLEDSKSRKSLPQQRGETGSPPASPVPSPSAPQHCRNHPVPSHSFAPPASQTHHAGSLAASASEVPPPHAWGSQSSPTTAHPDPGVPGVPAEVLAQALVQQFRMSLDAATRNLSTVGGDPLTLLPPAPSLSFLFKSTNGMICLQPMQESPLPTKFPNTSVGGLVSIQQILAASNSSALDLVNLQHLSPSSLVLVRPVFILLPTDRAGSPFPQGEGDHKTAHLVPNVGTPESSHVKTSSSYHPTTKSETTLATVSSQQAERTKVTSQPTNPNSTALMGLFQAVTSGPGPLLDPGMGMSSTAQALPLHRMPEVMPIPAPRSQEAKGTDLLFLNRVLAQPDTSPVPPSAVPTQHSPHTSPRAFFPTENPHSTTPLLPAKGLGDFPVPSQPLPTSTGAAGRVQPRGTLQTAAHGQGSVTSPSSDPAPCVGCFTSRSAGTTKTPLKVFPSTRALQGTPQGLPRTTGLLSPVVPSTSSAASVIPAGNEPRAPSGGVPVPAPAAQTHITSAQPDLTQHLEFTPTVTTGRPTAAPAQTPLPTEGQMKTTIPGTLLAAVTPPRVHSSPPSAASAHVALLAALKRDQTHHAPAEPFPQVGEITKPVETSTTMGKGGAGRSLGVSVSLPATANLGPQQPPTAAPGAELVVAAAQPSVPTGPVTALQKQPKPSQGTPQAPLAVPALPAAQHGHTTPSLSSTKAPHVLPASAVQPDPNVVLPTASRANPSAVLLAALGKGESEAEGGTAPSSHLPTQAPMSASPRHPLEKVSLEDTMEEEPAHSSPGSAVSATGAPTTAAFAVSAKRLVNKVTNQSAAFQKGSDAEMLLTKDLIPLLPTPESPSNPPGSLVALTAQGSALGGVAGTDSAEGLLLNTEGEEMGRTKEVTEGAAEGLVTVVTLQDSQPSAPSDTHQRRGLHSDLTVLNGLAMVSDDACGSGNYTVQLSLSPAAHTNPEPHGPPAPSQETFLALVALQENSSHPLEQPLEQPLVQIRSCCVSPSTSPTAPGAQCCLFHRLPFECRHIQLLQSSRSGAASFTIQLFQMLNHSVAYLHCELTVCLHGKAGCEQDCFEGVEPILQPSDRNSYGNLHNLVSFGPVWRMKDRFLYKPVEGPGSAVLLPILLGSLAGFAVLGSAFISLWLHHRQKTKPLCHPPFGEVHGL